MHPTSGFARVLTVRAVFPLPEPVLPPSFAKWKAQQATSRVPSPSRAERGPLTQGSVPRVGSSKEPLGGIVGHAIEPAVEDLAEHRLVGRCP
jgi:hypothetical protein